MTSPTQRYSAEELKRFAELHGTWQIDTVPELREMRLQDILLQAAEDSARLEQIEQWAKSEPDYSLGCLNPKNAHYWSAMGFAKEYVLSLLSPLPSPREER